MLAIVETGGKQYQMQEGRYIDVELLGKEENDSLELDKIVMIVAGEQSRVGQPYVEGAVVKATVLKNAKDKKIIVYKQRCKKGYRKKQGHRQQFCRIMIESIDFPGKENIVTVEAKVEEKKAVKADTPKKTTKKPAVKKEKVAESTEVVEEQEAPKPKKKAKAEKEEVSEEVQEAPTEEKQESGEEVAEVKEEISAEAQEAPAEEKQESGEEVAEVKEEISAEAQESAEVSEEKLEEEKQD